MKKLFKIFYTFVAIGVLLTQSGCGLITLGMKQRIELHEETKGASVYVNGKKAKIKRSNSTYIKVRRKGKSSEVEVKKNGYETEKYTLHSTLNSAAFFMDFIFTMGMGWIIDYPLQTIFHYPLNELDIDLQKKFEKIEEPDALESFYCEEVKFNLKEGTKIIQKNGYYSNDEKEGLEKDIKVKNYELTYLVNENIFENGFRTPFKPFDNKEQLNKENVHKSLTFKNSLKPKYKLVGNIDSLTFNIFNKSSLNTTLCISNTLGITWKLLDLKSDKEIFSLTTLTKSTNGFSGSNKKENPISTIFHSQVKKCYYKLVHNEKFIEALERQIQTKFLPKDNPISIKKTNAEMSIPDIMKSSVTVLGKHGHGSGSIISKEQGLILTNHHVIESEDSLKALLNSGEEINLQVISYDEEYDLALLKTDSDLSKFETTAIPLGIAINSTAGIDLYGIGTPFSPELGQSVSKGILSGKRMIDDKKYLQTDLKVSPGYSGGALVHNNNLIGIINAKIVSSGVEGVSFAIPIQEALQQLNITVEQN